MRVLDHQIPKTPMQRTVQRCKTAAVELVRRNGILLSMLSMELLELKKC